jgi:hypothetical protein
LDRKQDFKTWKEAEKTLNYNSGYDKHTERNASNYYEDEKKMNVQDSRYVPLFEEANAVVVSPAQVHLNDSAFTIASSHCAKHSRKPRNAAT